MIYNRPDSHDQSADEWIIHPPPPSGFQEHVVHHVMGILRMRYPGQRGERRAVAKEALEKYGPRLFEQIENIVRDCHSTGASLTFIVRWREDGSPYVYPVESKVEDVKNTALTRRLSKFDRPPNLN